MTDLLPWAMLSQGAANALGNLGNAQRGQRTVPANNVPMLMMMQQRKEQDQAKQSIMQDPDLTDEQKRTTMMMMNVDPGQAMNMMTRWKTAKTDPGSWKDNFMATGAGTVLGPPDPMTGKPTIAYSPPAKAPGVDSDVAEIDQLRERINSFPPGDPNRAIYQRQLDVKLKKIEDKKGAGINIYDPNTGSLIASVGGSAALTKPVQTDLQKKLISTGEGLARLEGIRDVFDEKYQTWAGKMGAAWSSVKEKAGVDLAPEDRQYLADFADYKMSAINNINLYIKDITGAQMSAVEAERLTRGMPNPGQGLFDGDSPTEFMRKLNSKLKELKKVQARYSYALNNNIPYSKIPLESVDDIIRKRGDELIKSYKESNPGASEQDGTAFVKQILSREFGVGMQ